MLKRLFLIAAALATAFGTPAAAVSPAQYVVLSGAAPKPAIRVITNGGFDSRITYTGASLKMDVDATGKPL